MALSHLCSLKTSTWNLIKTTKLKSRLSGLIQGYSGKLQQRQDIFNAYDLVTPCKSSFFSRMALLFMNSKTQVPRERRKKIKSLHRFLSGLGLLFALVEHIACDILNLERESHLMITTRALPHPPSISVTGSENHVTNQNISLMNLLRGKLLGAMWPSFGSAYERLSGVSPWDNTHGDGLSPSKNQ